MIKFPQLMESISEGMLLLDGRWRICFANSAIKDMMQRHDLCNMHLLELLDDTTVFAPSAIYQLLRKPAHWRGDANLRRLGAPSLPIRLVVDRYGDGNASYYTCVLSDISEYKRMQSELTELSLLDALTGLNNRVCFMQLLEMAMQRLRRESDRLALLFVDMDDFKKINDCKGHVVGDQCLQEIAKRLKMTVQAWQGSTGESGGLENCPGSLIARLGGDEFVILLNQPLAKEVLQLAHQISAALSEPWHIHEQKLELSATIGIAYAPEHAASGHDLIQCADQAMYYAKSSGKGMVCEFFHQLLAQTQIPFEMNTDS